MQLYGDGVHDDTQGLQSLIDAGNPTVRVPDAKVCYLISKPLRLHSNQSLQLGRFCHIKLAPSSNCLMLTNAKDGVKNIEVVGGIWDYNNLEQSKNPFLFPFEGTSNNDDDYSYEGLRYPGFAIHFRGVEHIRIANLTLKDTITFAITLEVVQYFTVENITFDFNHGNPYPVNMDGVHIDGCCRFGVIRNLKGTCYDDLVALNSPEGTPGDISDIEIDGLFATDCHSAVRIHAGEHNVENVSISNVYGTYYQYCIGFSTPNDKIDLKGYFDNIVIRNVYASKAERLSIYQKDGTYIYPLIWLQETKTIKNLLVNGIFRNEENVCIPTIGIKPGGHVENLIVKNIIVKNNTGEPMPIVANGGVIDCLIIDNVRAGDDELLENTGTIKNLAMPFGEKISK